MKHIACSNLARVMTCAGSTCFKDLPPEVATESSKEGTAAGEYLEVLLTRDENTLVPTHARNGVPFDDDMRFHAVQVAGNIKETVGANPILCERDCSWLTRSGIKIQGRGDAVFEVNNFLYVDDYKYGWSLVEAEENWQLLAYAIGEVILRGKTFEQIVMRIHQPRPHHEDGDTREWRISYKELLDYKELIDVRMDQISNGEDGLSTSSNCKYCPAAVACPAFNKSFFRSVEVVHDFVQDTIDDNELSFQLDLIDRVGEIFKIKKSSIESLAVSRIANGKLINNWTCSQSYGNRKWKKNVTPDMIKALTGKDIIEKKVLSPAKAEKMGVDSKLVDSITERYNKGQTLKRCNTSKLGEKIFGTSNA
jgi:hypothetical protein